jgi:hypothetical protein
LGYCMRFITPDTKNLDISSLEKALRAVDNRYRLAADRNNPPVSADIFYGSERYGQLKVDTRGDGLFEKEIKALTKLLEETRKGNVKRVVTGLVNAQAIVVVQALCQDRETGETLERIDPLWEILFQQHDGLLQADGEGYYDTSALILAIE